MLAEIMWNRDTLAVLLGCGIPITAIVCTGWYKVARTTSENELKRTLAEKGMSADEIIRVVSNRHGRRCD